MLRLNNRSFLNENLNSQYFFTNYKIKFISFCLFLGLILMTACDTEQRNKEADVSKQGSTQLVEINKKSQAKLRYQTNNKMDTKHVSKDSNLTWYSWLEDLLPKENVAKMDNHQIKDNSNNLKDIKKSTNGNNNKVSVNKEIIQSVTTNKNKDTTNKQDDVDPFTGLDAEQRQVLKENYFCDLAYNARQTCESHPRSEKSMEICLKLSAYFTNSRHCGYQP